MGLVKRESERPASALRAEGSAAHAPERVGSGSERRVVPGRVSAFSDFNPSLQTQQITILLEPEAAAEQELRPVLLEARQRVLAAFQVANFEVHAVPGWLVKSSSGKTARSANRAKWHEWRPSEVLA